MPAIPPMAVKITDQRERKLAPHKLGIKPPIVEPIVMHKRIKDLGLIYLILFRSLVMTIFGLKNVGKFGRAIKACAQFAIGVISSARCNYCPARDWFSIRF